jgi:hypothetical protein
MARPAFSSASGEFRDCRISPASHLDGRDDGADSNARAFARGRGVPIVRLFLRRQ